MHDGIELEKRGTPAAVICSEPFVNTARAVAEVRGLPDYPFAIVTHPVGSAAPDALREKARAALQQIIEILQGR